MPQKTRQQVENSSFLEDKFSYYSGQDCLTTVSTAEPTRAVVHQYKYSCYTHNSTAYFWNYKMYYIQLKAHIFLCCTILKYSCMCKDQLKYFLQKFVKKNCLESQIPMLENILSILKEKKNALTLKPSD